jgi:bifunctional UDP-N-acetylglucosamine pyrophosphorylase/glucosamine-1-phosphate N-acetyltransferase
MTGRGEGLKDFKCLILAAGEGTRMKSSIPKVLQPICGKPMIGYILKVVKNLGINEVIVVVGHKNRQVRDFLGKSAKIIQQKRLLGTAHAVNETKKLLSNYKGNLLILYGDTPLLTESTLDRLIRQHAKSRVVCTLLTTIVKNPTGYGRIVRDGAGRIKRIVEEKDASIYERVIEEVNTGVYCFDSKELFLALKEIKADNVKKEFYLTDAINIFYKKGLRIESLSTETPEEILGINTKNELAKAQDIIRRRILFRLMENGVTIINPNSTFIDEEVSIGTDTVIYPFVYIEGKNVIGKNCRIGPFCRIRDNCFLEDDVVIGNFVELVRTSIKKNTKIKHQCYLGDALIGRRVNVGAGTVIANYDGENKYKTIIEDDAFIGSGVILIAPVKIGQNSICGAGAVVPKKKNVSANTIVVGMPAHVLRKKKKFR